MIKLMNENCRRFYPEAHMIICTCHANKVLSKEETSGEEKSNIIGRRVFCVVSQAASLMDCNTDYLFR